MVLGRRRASTCVANSFCELYTLGREDLLELFKRFPKEGAAVYDMLATEMRRAEGPPAAKRTGRRPSVAETLPGRSLASKQRWSLPRRAHS